jgi:hypothetical protein
MGIIVRKALESLQSSLDTRCWTAENPLLLVFDSTEVDWQSSSISKKTRNSLDGENMDDGDPGVGEQPRQRRAIIPRAIRHELRIPLRYRLAEQESWCMGETINMSESGLLFTSNEMLEIGIRVQITFQNSGNPMLKSSTRAARVVRRILSNWPETRIIFGARYCS